MQGTCSCFYLRDYHSKRCELKRTGISQIAHALLQAGRLTLSRHPAGRDKVLRTPELPGRSKARTKALRKVEETKAEHYIQLFGFFFCEVLRCVRSDRA